MTSSPPSLTHLFKQLLRGLNDTCRASGQRGKQVRYCSDSSHKEEGIQITVPWLLQREGLAPPVRVQMEESP